MGLLILAGGFVLRGSAEAATRTVAEVLALGGVVISVVGTWMLVTRFVQSRED